MTRRFTRLSLVKTPQILRKYCSKCGRKVDIGECYYTPKGEIICGVCKNKRRGK